MLTGQGPDIFAAAEVEGTMIRVMVRALAGRDRLDIAAEHLLKDLCDAVDVAGAVLWMPDDGVLLASASWAVGGPERRAAFATALQRQRLKPGVGLPGTAWELSETRSLLAADAGPSLGTDAPLPLGLTARIAVPARLREKTLGVVAFYSDPNCELADAEDVLRAMGPTAHLLGSLLKRWDLQAAQSKLTRRELEMLALASTGNTTARIAESLSLSPWTVKTHFENIRFKLGVTDRTAAVAYAIRSGMIG